VINFDQMASVKIMNIHNESSQQTGGHAENPGSKGWIGFGNAYARW
jgi:hypothetical protein